jgi:phage terminase small subunit
MCKLTPKQKAFCDYYIQTGNATEAYKMAGYKNYKSAGVEASKTLKNPKVKEYLDKWLKPLDDKRIAKAEEVLEYLTRVMRGEEKDQLGLDASLQDRTKAAELLGRRYRLFTEKLDIDANVNKQVQFVDDLDELEE